MSALFKFKNHTLSQSHFYKTKLKNVFDWMVVATLKIATLKQFLLMAAERNCFLDIRNISKLTAKVLSALCI